MNLKDQESMNIVVGNLLRYGVIISGSVIIFGILRFATTNAFSDSGAFLSYYPNTIPHGNFNTSLQGLIGGLWVLDPFSVIELGAILLMATPVSRVFASILLFGAEGDRLYVLVTTLVFCLLVFSIFITPFIPGFEV